MNETVRTTVRPRRNRREHGRNKEAIDNQASRIVQHGAREQHRDDEAHKERRGRAELNGAGEPALFHINRVCCP